jgi:hypothetical protein
MHLDSHVEGESPRSLIWKATFISFIGYSDSDHAGNIDTNKSTSGMLFFLVKSLISWQSVGGSSLKL